jgi:hypothetical protein
VCLLVGVLVGDWGRFGGKFNAQLMTLFPLRVGSKMRLSVEFVTGPLRCFGLIDGLVSLVWSCPFQDCFLSLCRKR